MKKHLALLLAGTMCVSLLAGCGGTSAGGSSTPSAGSASGSSSASVSSTYKLGGIGPLTGDAAIYGTAAMNGAQIAVDEINAKGGVQLEFRAEDDVADGETSVNAYNSLLDWGMQVLVGPVTTGAAISVSAKAFEDRVFALTPSASSTDVINGKDNMFQVCFTDPNQGTGAADYIADNIAGSKVAVIYRNDDAYSQGIRDTFVAEAAAKNLEVVYEGTFTKDTATDFSVQLTAAQAAGADTIFLPIYYQPASVILKQANDMGYAPTFFGVDGMDGILTMEGFDSSLAEGVMLLTPFSADAQDEMTQSFVAEYQKRFNETPNQFAADGYDAVYILYTALEKANCTPDMSAEEICEALLPVMPTISVDGLTGAGMTWAATGEVSKAPMAVVIKDGVYVTP
ncbi:MAG: ABC transporter substrate-binding protein [Lawsonibacter sp.]